MQAPRIPATALSRCTGDLVRMGDEDSRLLRQVGVDVRAPAVRQQAGQDRQHEYHADCDADGRQPCAGSARRWPAPGDRAPSGRDLRRWSSAGPRIAQRSRRPAVQDRRADEEAGKGDNFGEHQDDDREDHDLRGQHRPAAGTASSEARITPVEYSVAITSTPRTAMVSWPRPMPAPKMKPTGSATIVASRPEPAARSSATLTAS